jgi:hypothetical protein
MMWDARPEKLTHYPLRRTVQAMHGVLVLT